MWNFSTNRMKCSLAPKKKQYIFFVMKQLTWTKENWVSLQRDRVLYIRVCFFGFHWSFSECERWKESLSRKCVERRRKAPRAREFQQFLFTGIAHSICVLNFISLLFRPLIPTHIVNKTSTKESFPCANRCAREWVSEWVSVSVWVAGANASCNILFLLSKPSLCDLVLFFFFAFD